MKAESLISLINASIHTAFCQASQQYPGLLPKLPTCQGCHERSPKGIQVASTRKDEDIMDLYHNGNTMFCLAHFHPCVLNWALEEVEEEGGEGSLGVQDEKTRMKISRT